MTIPQPDRSIVPKDDARPRRRPHVANDNDLADPAAVDAALTRIAEAIGRHIAREHIRFLDAANDNEAGARGEPPAGA
jgi:hypothetical protein